MKKIQIGTKHVGDGEPTFFIAEIGINHNGSVDIAKELIDVAADAGCDAVKFQKRTIDVVYTKEELDKPRESPWGTTNRQQKEGLEFGRAEYKEIDKYCTKKNMMWFASSWDIQSIDFFDEFDVPCYKIPSALLTHDNILQHTRTKNKPVILSTGMSTMDQIHHAVDILGEDKLVILHCTSSYPSSPQELNLNMIPTLKDLFSCPIGYSGHETGIFSSAAAAVKGACMIERHITLDRAMYGSDQAASLGPPGLTRLVRDIHLIPTIMGDGIKRVYDTEVPIMEKLRRKN